MQTSIPKVSICIPVRNGEKFIFQAIESALNQTYKNYEIIVIDNASTDGTVNLVSKFFSGNGAVRFFKNHENIGLVGNFNACLQHARGEYIKFLCADDLISPTCIDKMVKALDENLSCALVVSQCHMINGNGLNISRRGHLGRKKKLLGAYVINRCLFGTNYIGEPSSVMFRRQQASRGFRSEFTHLMDLEMWFYLLEQGDLYNISESLCSIRRHQEQMTMQSIKSGALIEDNINIYDEYKRKPYVNHCWINIIERKVRVSYRTWICRKSLNDARINEILVKHSYPFFYYYVLPVLLRILNLFHIKRFYF